MLVGPGPGRGQAGAGCLGAESCNFIRCTWTSSGNAELNPLRDKNEGTYVPGGRRDDIGDLGLSRRSPRVKPIPGTVHIIHILI